MKKPNDVRLSLAMQRRAGSPLPSHSTQLTSVFDWGLSSCNSAHDLGLSQLARRGIASTVDPLLPGSSLGLSSPGTGYGPCRHSLTKLKVFGGAQTSFEPQARRTAEAPSTSTSEQLPRETVTFGTLAVQSLAKLLSMEVDTDTSLSFEQQTLFDLCSNDLLTSCQHYGRSPTLHGGQQLLMDLKRMQNLIQRHLSVPGEVEHSVANIFIISQCLISILEMHPGGAGAGLGLLQMM